MLLWFAAFIGLSVGMVYFKQEGMLYHPAVPSEKYRYPENMTVGYRNPNEAGMEYKDVYINHDVTIELNSSIVLFQVELLLACYYQEIYINQILQFS